MIHDSEKTWTMTPQQEALALRASRIRQEDGWHSKAVCEVAEILVRDAETTLAPGAK